MKPVALYWINSRNPRTINKHFFHLYVGLKLMTFAFSYKFTFMRWAECEKVILWNRIGLRLKFVFGPHRNSTYFLSNMNRVMVSLFFDYRSLEIISQKGATSNNFIHYTSSMFLLPGKINDRITTNIGFSRWPFLVIRININAHPTSGFSYF